MIFPETHSLQGFQSSAPSMVPYWIPESSIQGKKAPSSCLPCLEAGFSSGYLPPQLLALGSCEGLAGGWIGSTGDLGG